MDSNALLSSTAMSALGDVLTWGLEDHALLTGAFLILMLIGAVSSLSLIGAIATRVSRRIILGFTGLVLVFSSLVVLAMRAVF